MHRQCRQTAAPIVLGRDGTAGSIARALPPSPLRVHLALLTVSLLFGGNYVFSKGVLGAVPPRAWVELRLIAATALLVPLALWLRKRRSLPGAKVLLGLLVAAFFGTALNQALYNEGLARTTPEHSAVINACIPTFTVIVAVLARQERLTWRLASAVAIALLGVLYLTGVDRALFGGEGGGDAGGATLLGDLLSTGNALAFAIHLVMMRRLSQHVDPWTATALLFGFGLLLLLPWSLPELNGAAVEAVTTPPVVWMALYVVLGATVLTYVINTWALRHTTSSQVALYINVQPMVAACVHVGMGGPVPGMRFVVALALVAFALWLQTRGR